MSLLVLLASVPVWHLRFKSQNQCLQTYYRPLLSNFLKISRSSDDEKRKGGQEEGDVVEVDEMVEVDRKVDQWCCGIKINCFCPNSHISCSS